jgi:signal transduction histidine kinase
VRPDGVLRDEETLRDLVGPEMLVQQEQHLDLASGEHARDLLGDAVQAASLAHAVEQPARDPAGERGLAPGDTAEERRDLFRRLGLQQVARGTGPDGGQQVLLGVGRREDDDLAVRRLLSDARERGEPVHARHGQVEKDEVGLEPLRSRDRVLAVRRVADDLEALLREQGGEGIPGQGMVVDQQDPLGHLPLIGSRRHADKRSVEHRRSQTYRSWVVSEVLLVALLASATALFAASGSLQSAYELPEARLVLDTAIAVVAAIVAVLASVRFLVDGRTLDLLVAAGFWSIALGTTVFGIVPVLSGESLPPAAAWALVGARLLGAALIAVAPWADGRLQSRRPALLAVGIGIAALLASAGLGLRTPQWEVVPEVELVEGSSVVIAATLLAVLWLVALLGFAVRYRRYGRDLDSWLCLSVTLALFADLHFVLTPVVSSQFVLQGDFLRLIAYGILLVGVWRAIADAEFGRAVADERARVARDIHDGLAQYLFAISTQVNMLETGGSLEQVLPRLKRASTSAQQEARFAVLALSSAGGSARFDSALRRYVEVLTADGELEVEVDVDRSVRLAPDEQIEVFRIVQEGLGNARRHAGAKHVDVEIVQRAGRRVVRVRDDGIGFDEETTTKGQGLENMKLRADAIQGELSLNSTPGRGTAIEVVLRPV